MRQEKDLEVISRVHGLLAMDSLDQQLVLRYCVVCERPEGTTLSSYRAEETRCKEGYGSESGLTTACKTGRMLGAISYAKRFHWEKLYMDPAVHIFVDNEYTHFAIMY